MTDYTNLLRMLKTYEDGYGLYQDAAAAIEELQAEIRESMQKCAECSKWNEPLQVGKAGNQFTLNATEPPQEVQE